jgi:hypothetical protein
VECNAGLHPGVISMHDSHMLFSARGWSSVEASLLLDVTVHNLPREQKYNLNVLSPIDLSQ